MPEFSLNVLKTWKPETLIAEAARLGEKTDAFAEINNEIADLNNRAAAQSVGTAADARYEYLKATTSFTDDKIQLMREEKQIWEEAGHDLAAKHNRLFTAVQAAMRAGFVVNSKGGIEGDYPRQSQELFDKHAEAVGRAKHELEQADEHHAQKIREISGRIKEGTGGEPHKKKDWLTFGGEHKDEPLDPDKAAKDRAQRIADGAEPLPADPKALNDLFKHVHADKDADLLKALQRRYPDIGNKPGFPFEDRDICNRQHLDDLKRQVADEIQRLQREHPGWKTDQIPGYKENPHMPPGFNDEQKQTQQLNNPEWAGWKARMLELQHRLDGYNNLQATLDKTTLPKALGGDGLPRFLGFLDDKGHAAVSIGDPDHASKVSTFVPGTGQDMAKMSHSDDYSARLYQTAHDMNPSLGPNAVSVTTWMGYDRPMEIFEPGSGTWAGDPKFALNGAQNLDDWQAGLRFSHDDENLGRAYQTVIGHSYGSVEVGASASNGHHLDADAMVGVGTPGMIGYSAHDMNINQNGRVFIATADNDMIRVSTTLQAPLAKIGEAPLGNDPTTWGDATQFKTDPGKKGDGWFTGDLSGDAHSSYFQPDSTGLQNMGRIIDGQEPTHQ